MPEMMEEAATEAPTKGTVQPVTVWSTISGIALSAALTLGISEKAEQDAYQAKLERAKCEIVAAKITPETVIETLRDTVIKGDTVTLTDIDTIPARREYWRSIALGYIAPVADTIIITYTRKRGDSILYYGVAPLEIGDCIRGDFNVDKMN